MHEHRLPTWSIACPYCDSRFDLLVDVSQGSHETWEDCPRCCAPIHLKIEIVSVSGEIGSVIVGSDNDVI